MTSVLDGDDVFSATGVFGCGIGSVLIDVGDRHPGAVLDQYLAVSRPIPPPPPVTIATLPSNVAMMNQLSLR